MYLFHYFHQDVKAKGSTDRLSADDVKSSLASSSVNDLLRNVPQGPSNTVPLFVREEDVEKVELPTEAAVRIKTVGASPFVGQFCRQLQGLSFDKTGMGPLARSSKNQWAKMPFYGPSVVAGLKWNNWHKFWQVYFKKQVCFFKQAAIRLAL